MKKISRIVLVSLFFSFPVYAGIGKKILKGGALIAAGVGAQKIYSKTTRPSDSIAADCTYGINPSNEQIKKVESSRNFLKNYKINKISEFNEDDRLVFFISFDGTANHGESYVPYGRGVLWPAPRYTADGCIDEVRESKGRDNGIIYSTLPSNPRIIYTLLASNNLNNKNFTPLYIAGVGTHPNLNPLSVLLRNKDQFSGGSGMLEMVSIAKEKISNVIKEKYNSNKDYKITIVTTGFSRGAAAARIFHNDILSNGISDRDGSLKIDKKNIEIAASVLFDTVSTSYFYDMSNIDFSIPKEIPIVFHITAENEYRYSFPLHEANGENVKEVKFPGAHSDIGGTYRLDGISAATLDGAISIFQKLGFKFSELNNENYPNKNNYYIHDSRWFPIGDFSNQLKKNRKRVKKSIVINDNEEENY